MSESDLPQPDAAAPPLDAEAILAAELPLALRGYRIADVDALLGELALQVAASDAELTRLRALVGEPDPGTVTRSAVVAPPIHDAHVDAAAASAAASVPSTPAPATTAAPVPPAAAAPVSPLPVAEAVVPAGSAVLIDPVEALPGSEASPDERPREVTVVASAARRRALVPSLVLTVAAIVALVVGWRGGDRTAVVASIVASAVALLGVGIAVLVTRARRSD